MYETRLDELGFSLGCETRQENWVEENKLKKTSEKKKKKKKKYCIWQFNFCEFSPLEDVCACESIDLLRRAGIDFNKFKRNGITFARFGEVFMSSGVVLNPEVHWITFHCAYDIGYLLRVLTSKKLPELESDFMNVVRVFFPTLYDIKYMMKFHALHGSLTNLAISLGVDRLGESHQAGSDSLLTSCVFREIKESYCNGSTEQYAGVLYGLGVDSLSY
jgi:CCR4-NOT transcription complex subunit 7/8